MNEITFQSAKIDDLTGIENIEYECFTNPWDLKSLKNEFDKDYCKIIIARNEDNFLIGYIIFYLIFDQCEIIRIAVKKTFQNMNYGHKIIEKLFNLLNNNKNITKIILEVNEKNKNAIKLYKKTGFIEISKRKNYYQNDSALIMEKSLWK